MSAAPDLVLLAELRAGGLRLSPLAGGMVHVTPRERLTDDLRARIVSNKPALLSALEAERLAALNLERRIRVMATRWEYTPEDLADALAGARENPAGWLLTVEVDEGRADLFRRIGRRYPQ